MAQSLAKIYVHVAFSTKNQHKFLTDQSIRKEMHAYLASILKAYDSPALLIGGVSDHVHILSLLSRTHALSKIIAEIKRNSSKWVKTKGDALANFQWQNGYGAFSVSFSNVAHVQDYILNQENHHRRMTFQDELRALLIKHQVEFDERYVWD